jgi:hypothetical protein
MEFIYDFSKILLATCRDVLPIIILIVSFQLLVLRQPIPHLRRLIVGGVYVDCPDHICPQKHHCSGL